MDNKIKSKVLSAIPKGKENAISAKNLAISLGLPSNNQQVILRKIIKIAIEEDGELIGSTTSTPQGFFWIENKEELISYLDSLENRIKKTINRRNSLIENWNQKNKAGRDKFYTSKF
jgi:hypothetical protein